MSQPTAPQPWSQRFETALHPAIARFNASISFDINLIEYDITGSQAHSRMLAKVGIISAEEGEMLVNGLEQIRQEYRSGNFKPGIDAEDVHFAVERRPGYTHLQRAQPISLAHHLLAYFEMAQRDWTRLDEIYQRVNVCPLGSGALAGTPHPIDRHYTAELLDFGSVGRNSLDGVSDRDFAVEFLCASSLIMVHLSRLSEEVILWSSQEFSFVKLSDRVSTGSSIMPQKKNPDVPELVRGKTGRVFGHLQGLLTIIKGLPLAYNKDMQEDKEGIFDAVVTVRVCLEAMTILIDEGIEFQTKRLGEAVAEDFSNATDVADYLASKGVPFREAYQLVGKLVKTCTSEGILLKDLSVERWKTFHPQFEADIVEAIAPAQVVKVRNSYGGTGFDQVRIQLEAAKKLIA